MIAVVIAVGLLLAARAARRNAPDTTKRRSRVSPPTRSTTPKRRSPRSRRAAIRCAAAGHRGAAGRHACSFDAASKKVYIRDKGGAHARCRDRQAGRRRARRSQDGPPQQPAAPRGRGRARRPDAARRPIRRKRSRPRRPCSSRATPRRCRRSMRRIAKETDPRVKRALERGARRRHPLSGRRHRSRQARRRRA